MTKDLADFYKNQHRENVAQIVQDLRLLADEVERHGLNISEFPSVDGTPAISVAAGNVVHDLAWGFANLHIDRLTRNAAKADRWLALEKETGR